MDQVDNFENKLTAVLRPVKPRAGYVDRLKHSLKTAPYAVMERDDNTTSLLMVILGLVTAMVAFILLRKMRP